MTLTRDDFLSVINRYATAKLNSERHTPGISLARNVLIFALAVDQQPSGSCYCPTHLPCDLWYSQSYNTATRYPPELEDEMFFLADQVPLQSLFCCQKCIVAIPAGFLLRKEDHSRSPVDVVQRVAVTMFQPDPHGLSKA